MPDQTDVPEDLPLNESGTHVRTVAPSGVPWDCPIAHLPFALERGYKVDRDEPPADPKPFDPTDHNVEGEDGVNAYLQAAYDRGDVVEVERVLEVERAGKDRTTVNDPTDPNA